MMTPEQMDAVVNEHMAAEKASDVERALATLTPDVIHDVVGAPDGVLHGREQVRGRYSHHFQEVQIVAHTVNRRLHGDHFLVDECTMDVTVPGRLVGIPGHGKRVQFRMVQLFQFRDGLIARENVWVDAATIRRQLA
ncbi:nuclear transport factor 2 family protein [Pendulispora albinea]|uniref:Ester cyclase n=1 Tax=Pendulispora albinea TaxID=2741071 RepID=A0ABZ2LQZ0_9BACT